MGSRFIRILSQQWYIGEMILIMIIQRLAQYVKILTLFYILAFSYTLPKYLSESSEGFTFLDRFKENIPGI